MKYFDLVLFGKTKEKFGYDPQDLTYGSSKKVIHKCDVCGEDKETQFRRFLNGIGLSHKKCKYKASKMSSRLVALLLIRETEEKFGYNPQDLSQGSEKVILHKCDVCEKPKQSCFKVFFREKGLSHSKCKGKKIRQTNLEKYGVENPSQLTEIKEKKKQAYLNRYRVDNPLKDLKIREKRKRTCQRKYGTDHPLKNSEIKEKQRQTRLSKGYNWTEQRAQQFVQSFGYHLVKWGKGVHHKSIFRCPKEHIYTAKFNDFQQGNRCPACSESKGEKIVAEILTNQGVKFIREYRLQKDKKSLRLDFFIPSLNFGIEYDGEQHFRPVIGAFGNKTKEQAKATFKRQQQNDIKKNKICKDLGIKLIRIKYNENAKQMLESHLNEKGLTLDNRRLYNGTNWDCTRKF